MPLSVSMLALLGGLHGHALAGESSASSPLAGQTPYPHELFDDDIAYGWGSTVASQLSATWTAVALDQLIYVDMPPPPGSEAPGEDPSGPAPTPSDRRGPQRRGARPDRASRPRPAIFGRRTPSSGRTRRRPWLALALTMACASAHPPGEVSLEGEQLLLPAQDLQRTLATGWTASVESASFVTGLDDALLEAHHAASGVLLAVTWHGMPEGAWGTPPLSTPLDRLTWLAPGPRDGIPSATARLPDCDGSVERTVGSTGEVVQIAQAVPDGLLLWHAWGTDLGTLKSTVRGLVCEQPRGRP